MDTMIPIKVDTREELRKLCKEQGRSYDKMIQVLIRRYKLFMGDEL